MKETIKASLAGIGFVFDTDAFEALESYIDRLSRSYASNPDREEIIADIEARIVELILSHQNTETVVGIGLVNEITGQLGAPEEPAEGAEYTRPEAGDANFPRRLYRDPENMKLGGVCSGMARYFDVDPVLVRVGMFVPLFLLILSSSLDFDGLSSFLGSLFGAFVLLYFILWAVVPTARKPRQKLEMQGRRITATEIEREMSYTSSAREVPPAGPDNVLARFFTVIGAIFLFCVKFFLIIIGASLGLAALSIVIAIIGLAIGAPWVATRGLTGHDITLHVGNMPLPTAGFSAMILALIAIPLIILVYQLIRVSLSRRNSPTTMWILGGAWVLLAVFTGVAVLENVDIFRDWRGVRFRAGWWHTKESHTNWTTDTEEGWAIYEKNVQVYRDSLEKARGGDPATPDVDGLSENDIIFDGDELGPETVPGNNAEQEDGPSRTSVPAKPEAPSGAAGGPGSAGTPLPDAGSNPVGTGNMETLPAPAAFE